MITAAPDTTLSDGRDVCIIRAHQLEPGDVLVKHGSINLHVQSIRNYPEHGFTVIAYECTAGSGQRTLVSTSFACIQPRTEDEAH